MSKVRIYLPEEKIQNNLKIEDRDTLHKLKDVLVLKESEGVYVFNGKGKEYLYKIESISRKHVLLNNQQTSREEKEIKKKIILAFPLIKEQKIEYILEKATELGACAFYPFISERSIREKPSQEKVRRWERIVQEATRQSDWLWIPKIEETSDFSTLIKNDFKAKLCASINGTHLKNALDANTREAFLIIGPEGDFSPREFEKMNESNFQFVKLSKNLLRVETAAIFAVGLINYFIDCAQAGAN